MLRFERMVRGVDFTNDYDFFVGFMMGLVFDFFVLYTELRCYTVFVNSV